MKSELLIVFHQYLVNYSPYCVCLEFYKTFLTSLIFTGKIQVTTLLAELYSLVSI